MSERPATHANAVVSGGSGDNAEFAGPGAVGQSDETTPSPGARDANGNPTIAQFAGPGKTAGDYPTDAAGRDPITGKNPNPSNN